MDKSFEQKKRVLIIDNNREVCAALAERLGHSPGIEVVGTATTSELALQLAREHDPEVVILEVKMADGRGLEICRELTSGHPERRVVVLTALGDPIGQEAAFTAGASAYLLKDLDTGELLRSIMADQLAAR